MKKFILPCITLASFALSAYLAYENNNLKAQIASRPSEMRTFQNTMLFFKDINARQADGDYIFFGDSLVQGMSPYALGVKYVNMGIGGYTVNWINALVEKTDITKYKAVIIEGGVNDTLGGKGVKETRASFEKYFENASKAPKFYFVQTIPTVEKMHKGGNKLISELNQFTASLCEKYRNCVLIEAPDELKSSGNAQYYLPDGIHLNAAGYDIWTNKIKEELKNGKAS